MRNKNNINSEDSVKLLNPKSTVSKFRSAQKNGRIKNIPLEIYELAKEVRSEGFSVATIHQVTGLPESSVYAAFKRMKNSKGPTKAFRELKIQSEDPSLSAQSNGVSICMEISGFKISMPVNAIGTVIGQLRGVGLC